MAGIDFANSESRMNYLKENLGHLMNGIDKNYGEVLMDELMRRMEATVSDFNEEVKAMLAQLQGKKTTPRDNILASSSRPSPHVPSRPTAMESFEAPIIEPVIESKFGLTVELDDKPVETSHPEISEKPIKEVEIEVDLDGEELSEFEKKLRALSS